MQASFNTYILGLSIHLVISILFMLFVNYTFPIHINILEAWGFTVFLVMVKIGWTLYFNEKENEIQ